MTDDHEQVHVSGDELRARIEAIVAATGALASRIERIDALVAATGPSELQLQLSALLDLIDAARGCVDDAITFVEERVRAAKES